ncbi:MAG: hypothetical protein KDA28_08125, partial [Phycisphaerales bacterium]|nr:hypothetical protein [Phycisphaerales bacterium]
MRCRTCQYELWNLAERTCPECGSPYLPSDYDFVPNTVEFLCPNCERAYYGLDERGHPPRGEVTCECGFEVDLDQMILRPRDGCRTADTMPQHHPWLTVES